VEIYNVTKFVCCRL